MNKHFIRVRNQIINLNEVVFATLTEYQLQHKVTKELKTGPRLQLQIAGPTNLIFELRDEEATNAWKLLCASSLDLSPSLDKNA